MAHPEAVNLVHTTLNEIARVYPKGLLRWVRAKRFDLKEMIDKAEVAVEEAAKDWKPADIETDEKLQETLERLRWAYAEAIAAFNIKKGPEDA